MRNVTILVGLFEQTGPSAAGKSVDPEHAIGIQQVNGTLKEFPMHPHPVMAVESVEGMGEEQGISALHHCGVI